MKTSIVIAVYEGEKYIGTQLESIFAQTKLPEEIIISDDSPNDLTEKQIKKYTEKYPNIVKYFSNEKKLGIDKNFEKAISKSTGDLIFLCDQDDFWERDKIEKISSILMSSNDVAGVFCDSWLTDPNLNISDINLWRLRGFGNREQQKLESGQALDVFLKKVPCSGHNIAFKAELKDILLPFPEHSGACHCFDSWIGFIIAMAFDWQFLPEKLTRYRIHHMNSSDSPSCNFCQRVEDAKKSIKDNTFGWTADLLENAVYRVEERGIRIADKDLNKINERICFSREREHMSSNLLCRLPSIIKLASNGWYFRFGSGILNICQDIFLR